MSFFSKVGRRVVLSEYGETPLEAVDSFTVIEDFSPPDPASLAAHDVAVSIRSASVGWVDLIMASGQYQHMVSPPYCPGLEYSGVVEWVGSAVDKFKVGDRVMVDGLTAGPRSSGDYQGYGGYASVAIAPQDSLFPMPPEFSFDEACNLLGSYETAYHCLVACGQLQAGETVLIHGASGSTGLAAVHVAKLLGATVIATGRSDDKLAVVKAEGADHVINSRAEGDKPCRFRDQVKELTGGKGVDVVYDGVGGDISLESLRCVQFGARFLIVGWAGTPFVAKGKGGRGAPNANMLPTNLIMMKGLKVLGCPTVISTEKDPSIRKQRLHDIFAWTAAGKIKPHVSHRFALEDYKEAMHAKWSGKIIGGCVLNP
jgi:NADPH2:quinone reductase